MIRFTSPVALATLVAGLGLATAALAQPGGAMPTPDFVRAAAQTDAFERDAGKMAASMGHDAHVRDFGRMMMRDHAKTTAGLKMAIKKAHMRVPPPPPLDADQKQMLNDLRHAGRGFDRAYVDQQVMVHQKALGVMQGYAANGHDAPLRDAAAMTVPVVEHHLMMVKDMQSHMGR